jgi:RNA 3'-terminal phosphate cyclase (ATP)/RNA 3'-terminal phosphate cyclase (GTP)
VGRELRADLEAGVTADLYAADQLLVYLALAGGESWFTARELTSHAETAMWLIGRFLPVRFTAERAGGICRIGVVR